MPLTYLTNTTANAAIAAIAPSATNLAFSLHISTGPGNTGANEEAGSGYSAQTGQFAAASAGVELGPTVALSFTSTAWTGTLGYFGVWNSGHSTWYCGGPLTSTLVPPSSCTVIIAISGLSIAVAG